MEPEQGSPPSEEIPPRHRSSSPHCQRYSGKPRLLLTFSNSHLFGFDLGFGSGLTNKLYRHQSKMSSSKKRPVKGLWNRCLSEFLDWRYSQSWLVGCRPFHTVYFPICIFPFLRFFRPFCLVSNILSVVSNTFLAYFVSIF
jgi:hypothetical protein